MDKIAKKIEDILADYRVEDKLNPKKENILKWVSQFREVNQKIILEEMLHIFSRRYLTKSDINIFLEGLVKNKKLAGVKPKDYWSNVSLLAIQKDGDSQRMMNKKFNKIIKEELNIDLPENDLKKKYFLHLDDFLFTGNRLRTDLQEWFKTAPFEKRLDIIYIGYHKSGQYYLSQKWLKSNNKKKIKIKFWRRIELENTTSCQNVSHILWPTKDICKYDDVKDYIALQSDCLFRDKSQKPNGYCKDKLFSSEANRVILEEEFTLAGIKINKAMSDDKDKQRYWKPLGMSSFKGLGFGAMVFSYRNCPNNTPLAFWWGNWTEGSIWYPLFQRKTYNDLKVSKIFGAFDIEI